MFFEMYLWYFLIGILFCIFEVLFVTFYLLPIGIAAILTGIIAIFFFSFPLHIFSFVFFSLVLLFIISKWKKSRFLKPTGYPVVLGLVGQTGVVVEEFISPEKAGKIKIYADIWDIYFENNNVVELAKLKLGDSVKVTHVYGNRVSIKKL